MVDVIGIMLAAKDGGWVEYLIPVIIFAVYAIGGIAKAMSKKRQEQEQSGRSASSGSRYKPLDDSRSTDQRAAQRYKPIEAPQRSGPSRPAYAQGKNLPYAPRPDKQQAPAPAARQSEREPQVAREPANRPAVKYPQPAAVRPVRQQQPQQRDKPLPKRPASVYTVHAKPVTRPEVVKHKKVSMRKVAPVKRLKAEPKQDREFGVSLEKLTAADNLRNAIIYSEILGKPIALRDAGDFAL